MAKYELTWYAKNKRVMRFKEIDQIDVRLAKQIDEIKKHAYEVNINMIGNFTFQFEKGKFYIDFEDEDAMKKQNEAHLALIEKVDDKEKQKEILKGKYVNYISRQEFVLLYGDNRNVADLVEPLIKSI